MTITATNINKNNEAYAILQEVLTDMMAYGINRQETKRKLGKAGSLARLEWQQYNVSTERLILEAAIIYLGECFGNNAHGPIVTYLLTAPAQPDNEKAKAMFVQALQLVFARDHVEAINILRDALNVAQDKVLRIAIMAIIDKVTTPIRDKMDLEELADMTEAEARNTFVGWFDSDRSRNDQHKQDLIDFLAAYKPSDEQEDNEEQATAYVRQAIAAVQAGNAQAANNYANSALGTAGIDFHSRSLAATILMVETDEDIQALQNMKVYEDMVAYMAERTVKIA